MSKGPALVGLMRQYNWTKAAVLMTTEELWLVGGGGLQREMQNASIEVLKLVFVAGEFNVESLSKVSHSVMRVIVFLAYEETGHRVAMSAHRQGMSSPGWAWVLPEEFNIPELTISQMDGWLYVQPLLPSEGMQAFAEQVSQYTKSVFNITLPADLVDLTWSVALYEAVMLYAHAATKVLREGGNLRNGSAVTEAVRSTTFEGVGKRIVTLNTKGDRIESYEVMNYVMRADGVMSSMPVGVYNSEVRQYEAYDRAVMWPGSTEEVPEDWISAETICMAGSYFDDRAAACSVCSAGFFTSVENRLEKCSSCADQAHHYQDESNATTCKLCPDRTRRENHKEFKSVKGCTCEPKTWAPDIAQGHKCESCPHGCAPPPPLPAPTPNCSQPFVRAWRSNQ